jgi:hypothetical protein
LQPDAPDSSDDELAVHQPQAKRQKVVVPASGRAGGAKGVPIAPAKAARKTWAGLVDDESDTEAALVREQMGAVVDSTAML